MTTMLDAMFDVLFGALPKKIRWAIWGVLLAVLVVSVTVYLLR